jgi:hypothetical protein
MGQCWAVKNQHENKLSITKMKMLCWCAVRPDEIGLEMSTLESWGSTYSRKDAW